MLGYNVYVPVYVVCIITEDEDVGGGAQVDTYELLPAVNVLAQLPADFEENIVCSIGIT